MTMTGLNIVLLRWPELGSPIECSAVLRSTKEKSSGKFLSGVFIYEADTETMTVPEVATIHLAVLLVNESR